MNWFLTIASHPEPLKKVRSMRCHDLAEAERQIVAIENPNAWQAEIYALVAAEALLRWRNGLLSVPDFSDLETDPGAQN
jgi:hypothetical protein